MTTKVLIITGASKGIGKSTAQYFLEHDWNVINISRNSCDLENVKNILMDLGDIDNHAKELSEIIQTPQLICLVHNASMYIKDAIPSLNANELKKMLEINVVAPAILNRTFLPKMTTGSSIIYIGSTLSEKAVANCASYVISKHAVVGMMRATCQDLSVGIHTCCICPGFTNTEMMRAHLKNNPEAVATLKNRVIADRLIEPQEIASLVHYCANNPVINSSVIHANLGQIEY